MHVLYTYEIVRFVGSMCRCCFAFATCGLARKKQHRFTKENSGRREGDMTHHLLALHRHLMIVFNRDTTDHQKIEEIPKID